MRWFFRCWIGHSRKIERIENYERKKKAYEEYAKELGVNLDSIKLIYGEMDKYLMLLNKINDREKEWRISSFSLLSAIAAILSALAAWTAVIIGS